MDIVRRIDLNGEWDFVVDLDPKYHEKPFYAQPEWDRGLWRKVTVPGVWNHYEPRLDIYEGVCWFARNFQVDDVPENATCLLRFGGVNYLCEVYVNGAFAGSHEGGYTEFVLDVSGKVKRGENVLAVRVDNRATSMRLPPVLGYFNYGGIHRSVSIEIHPSAFIEEVFIRAEPHPGGGLIKIDGRAGGHTLTALTVNTGCQGAEAEAAVTSDGAFALRFEVPNISFWSPDSPQLYPVVVELRGDDESLDRGEWNIGFRKVESQGTRILLNSKAIHLKGLCYLYDSPKYGVALHPEQYKSDLTLMKEIGVNAIRSHFPFTRAFYEFCDRIGMLVWIEPPLYCINVPDDETGTVFADPPLEKLACAMLQEMIVHARNHPSVALYGIGNECNVRNKEAERFFGKLAAHVRRLDSTRLVSYASLYGNVGAISDIIDVIGVNAYWGWYDRLKQDGAPREAKGGQADLSALTECLRGLSEARDKPLLLTEFGADSVPGFRSDELELWSEDYHAWLLGEILKVAREFAAICGTFPFCFSDYRDPSKYTGAHWDGMNYKGIVTYDRLRKLPVETLNSTYKKDSP